VVGLLTCLASVAVFALRLGQAPAKNAPQLVDLVMWSLVGPLVFAIVALLILSRQPRNTIGWLLLAPVSLMLVGGPLEDYLLAQAPSASTPTGPFLLLAWANSWSWLLLIFPLLFIPLLFPNGRPPTPRWRWVSLAAIMWALLFVLLATLSDTITTNTRPDFAFDNPIGVLNQEALAPLVTGWIAGLLGMTVLCVAALIVRFRRANDIERKQIEWLAYACALFAVMYVALQVSQMSGWSLGAGDIWSVLLFLSVLFLPVAIGIAILRYQLYDIEIIIRRTLVYGLLTGSLALVYLAGIVLSQGFFRAVTGQESDLAIVGSTLAVAACFQPLRRGVQRVIDRRFYRRGYDAGVVLAGYGAALRQHVSVEHVSADLMRAVDETLQPAHLSLWLRAPEERP
jgi:hypothetical protein